MFLKNKNIIFKIRRSKVTDYAALTDRTPITSVIWLYSDDRQIFDLSINRTIGHIVFSVQLEKQWINFPDVFIQKYIRLMVDPVKQNSDLSCRNLVIPQLFVAWYLKKGRKQRWGIDTIKYHTWPRAPYGKVTKHKKTSHTREPRGQPFPSRWPQGCKEQAR